MSLSWYHAGKAEISKGNGRNKFTREKDTPTSLYSKRDRPGRNIGIYPDCGKMKDKIIGIHWCNTHQRPATFEKDRKWSCEPMYIYFWGNNPKRKTMKGRSCRIIASGKMNSILVEFANGQRECVSRRAIRRITPRPT